MKREFWFLVIFFILAYIVPLGLRPMIPPDEFRYAEIPREMILRGDYVVPYLAGARYFEKPALGYQLTAGMFHLFGVNRFALRLPCALAAGGAALLIFMLVRQMSRDEELAALSGALFLVSGMVYALGVFAVLDSQLNFFLTGTIAAYYFALQAAGHGRRRFIFLMLSGIMAGGAFLTKGFLAFAVPVAAILPFLIWQKRWRDIWTTPWIPAFFAALTALPWSIAVHLREPDYWRYFFWEEHVNRMFSSDSGQHPEPFWFFLPVILAGFIPVLFLIPAALKGWRISGRRIMNQEFIRYLICWLIFPFLLFSASSGKLATYILPCYVPAAVLTAIGLRRYIAEGVSPLFNRVLKILAGVLAAAAVFFILWQIAAPAEWCLYSSDETLKWILAGIAVFILCGALFSAAYAESDERKLQIIAAGLIPALIAANYAIPVRVLENKVHAEALAEFRRLAQPEQSIIAVNPSMMHSTAYVYGRTDTIVLFGGGELDYGLAYPDAQARSMNTEDLKELILSDNRPPVVLITQKNQDRKISRGTPPPDIKTNYRGIFLRRWDAK